MKNQPFSKILFSCFLLVVVVIGIILAVPRKIIIYADPIPVLTEEPLVNQAPEVSPMVYEIIKCESQWKENAVGDGGRAYGLAQFHRPTWDWLTELSGKDLDYENPSHQIELLTWALENGRAYLWTCARKLGYVK